MAITFKFEPSRIYPNAVQELTIGALYRHRDGRKVVLIGPHPHDGATWVVEDHDREDGDICVFTICERYSLVERIPDETIDSLIKDMSSMSQTDIGRLSSAINGCDLLTLQAEAHNDQERTFGRQADADARRVERYRQRRASIRDLRRRLIAIYKSVTGTDPWEDIPV